MHYQSVNPCRVSSISSFSSLLSSSFVLSSLSLFLFRLLFSLSSFSSLSLSIFHCLLSLSPCVVVVVLCCVVLSCVVLCCVVLCCVVLCCVVLCCVVLCCVVLCCVVLCGAVCGVWYVSVHNVLRVYSYHAQMLKHMCAWCRYTWRRVEWTHGREERGGGEGGEEGNRHQPRANLLLAMNGPHGFITCFRGSPKVTLNLTHLEFENRSGTTCSRFL